MAHDADLDLFEAFLSETDPGMTRLMAELLGIDDDVIDLTDGRQRAIEFETVSH